MIGDQRNGVFKRKQKDIYLPIVEGTTKIIELKFFPLAHKES